LRRGEEKIHAGAIGAGTRGGINGHEAESRTKKLRGAVHIAHADFDLLDAFAEFAQIAGDGAVAVRPARREDGEADAARKMELKFDCVMLRRHAREARRAASRADATEGIAFDGKSHGDSRRERFCIGGAEASQGRYLGIAKPQFDHRAGGFAAAAENLAGGKLAAGSVGVMQAVDE